MYIETCVDKTWLCNLCTFATRPIKVLFSYFKKKKNQNGSAGVVSAPAHVSAARSLRRTREVNREGAR